MSCLRDPKGRQVIFIDTPGGRVGAMVDPDTREPNIVIFVGDPADGFNTAAVVGWNPIYREITVRTYQKGAEEPLTHRSYRDGTNAESRIPYGSKSQVKSE